MTGCIPFEIKKDSTMEKPAHVQRMELEADILLANITKLANFIEGSDVFAALDEIRQTLMTAQLGAMQSYLAILNTRILLEQ